MNYGDRLDGKPAIGGSVLFRGPMPPRPADFARLGDAAPGLQVKAGPKPPEGEGGPAWAIELSHPEWGEAKLWGSRQPMPPLPKPLVQYDGRLTDGEKQTVLQGRASVMIALADPSDNLFRDRKRLFRFMRAVAGDDGVAAMDGIAQRFWSIAALDEELAHDADPDVETLFTLHAISDNGEPCRWVHSHGLSEIGHFDFDILRPAEELFTTARDTFRAIAYAIVLGKWQMGERAARLVHPGGVVAVVDADEFMRKTDRCFRELRDADEGHNQNRVVLCEPRTGRLSRWLGRHRPSQFLSSPMGDGTMVLFPNQASGLMADRARASYPLMRRLLKELLAAGCPCKTIVKLGYRVDGAEGPTDREHMWFSVNGLRSDSIDATLESSPHAIARMKLGDRATHDPDLLSDWLIFTPAGTVTPRDATAARRVREAPERYRETGKDA